MYEIWTFEWICGPECGLDGRVECNAGVASLLLLTVPTRA